MADNRIAYGLAKKYGIDTKGMSPKEVWDALKGHGVTQQIAQEKYSSDGNGSAHGPTKAEQKRLEELGIEDRLSRRDWVRIYQRLGEIKRGGYSYRTSTGETYIILSKMNEDDIPKVAVIGGTYENPIVKSVIEFETEEDMFDKMEEMSWH